MREYTQAYNDEIEYIPSIGEELSAIGDGTKYNLENEENHEHKLYVIQECWKPVFKAVDGLQAQDESIKKDDPKYIVVEFIALQKFSQFIQHVFLSLSERRKGNLPSYSLGKLLFVRHRNLGSFVLRVSQDITTAPHSFDVALVL